MDYDYPTQQNLRPDPGVPRPAPLEPAETSKRRALDEYHAKLNHMAIPSRIWSSAQTHDVIQQRILSLLTSDDSIELPQDSPDPEVDKPLGSEAEPELSEEEVDKKDEEDMTKGNMLQDETASTANASAAFDGDLFEWIKEKMKDVDLDEIEEWHDLYHVSVSKLFVERVRIKGSRYFKFENGRLCRAFTWKSTRLRETILQPATVGSRSLPWAYWEVVMFLAGKGCPNLSLVLDAVLADQSPHQIRETILGLSTEMGMPCLSAIYTMFPDVEEVDVVEELDSEGHWSTEPGLQRQGLYVGMTVNPLARYRSHVDKPVNRKVRQYRNAHPGIDWTMKLIVAFDERLPMSALHFLEVFFITLLDAADSRNGFNYNSMDMVGYETLVPGSVLRRLINALDLTLERWPDQRLPTRRDRDAWDLVTQRHLPSYINRSLRTMGSAITGAKRIFVYEKANNQHIDFYWLREQRVLGNDAGDVKFSAKDRFPSGRPTSVRLMREELLGRRSDAKHAGVDPPLGSRFCGRAALDRLIERFAESYNFLFPSEE